jgi:DNA-binding NarL/FixJ family response regulator
VPKRIMIVEEDFFIATSAEDGLIDHGFSVVGIATTAEEAVALAKAQKPDLALMDIRLGPGRDGVDAAIEIYAATGIRSIFVTAHTDSATIARAAPAEPIGWVDKPYQMSHLVSTIQSYSMNGDHPVGRA